MLARLGCLFIVVPILELALLIQLGQWVGVVPTVLLVAVTGMGGALLARTQGVRTLASVQLELARGRLPTRSLMDGASILVGGAFLMTPGILTDAAGFALLLPPTRRLIQGWVLARLRRALKRGTLHVTWMGTDRFGGRRGPGPDDDGAGEGGRPDRDPGPEGPPPRPGEIIQD